MRILGLVLGATLAVALLPQGTPSARAGERGKAQEGNVEKSTGDKGSAASSKAGKGLKANTTGVKRDSGRSGKIILW